MSKDITWNDELEPAADFKAVVEIQDDAGLAIDLTGATITGKLERIGGVPHIVSTVGMFTVPTPTNGKVNVLIPKAVVDTMSGSYAWRGWSDNDAIWAGVLTKLV